MTDGTAPTDGKQKPWLFQPGQSGNPKGRQKGSRNKLCEDFVADMLKAWEARGAAAINAMIDDRPGDFVKTVAALVPKDVNLNINNADELSDAELAERIRSLGQAIAPFLLGGTGNTDQGGEDAGSPSLTPRVH